MGNIFGHTQMARQLCVVGLNQELLSNLLIVGNVQKFQLSAVCVLPGTVAFTNGTCRMLSIFLRAQWNVGVRFPHVLCKNQSRRWRGQRHSPRTHSGSRI